METDTENGDESILADARKAWVAVLLPVLLLLPFINKAFHIDDPAYIYVAQHLMDDPVDFYGFEINWGEETLPVYEWNKNPPLFSYYLAPFGLLFGWSEISMHVAQLIPIALIALGLYRLASMMCGSPLLAVFLAVLTPGFLVSMSVVMCEALMLACYVWSMVYWIRGTENNDYALLIAGGVLIGFGLLTKYVVITAIPVLAAYTLLEDKESLNKLWYLLIPLLFLWFFEFVGQLLYGGGFLLGIVGVANDSDFASTHAYVARNSVEILSFTGACFVTLFFMGPLLDGWKFLAGSSLCFMATVLAVVTLDWMTYQPWIRTDSSVKWGYVIQLGLAVTAGAYLAWVTILDLLRNRDSKSLLLFILVFIIMAFSGFLNWTVNARSLLPALPALAIVVVRRFEMRRVQNPKRNWRPVMPLAIGGVLSLAVCHADYATASISREFVRDYATKPGVDLEATWFVGHWGLQYYLEQEGAQAIEFDYLFDRQTSRPVPKQGDRIVWWKNQYQALPSSYPTENAEVEQYWPTPYLTTMHFQTGAGFYSATSGTLPYYFGSTQPEEFRIIAARAR